MGIAVLERRDAKCRNVFPTKETSSSLWPSPVMTNKGLLPGPKNK